MGKDQESLLRMNFLIQAARLYQGSLPQYSSHFIYDFMQLSQKKMIRIDKKLKKKIDKKRFLFRKETKLYTKFVDKQVEEKAKEEILNEPEMAENKK